MLTMASFELRAGEPPKPSRNGGAHHAACAGGGRGLHPSSNPNPNLTPNPNPNPNPNPYQVGELLDEAIDRVFTTDEDF